MKMFKKLGLSFGTIILIILVLNLSVGGICTKYCVDFYYNKFTHSDTGAGISFLSFVIVGTFFGEFTIPVAVVTYLIVRPLW